MIRHHELTVKGITFEIVVIALAIYLGLKSVKVNVIVNYPTTQQVK